MRLIKTEEQNEGSLYREVSEDGTVELLVWPVIFGYRIRAGYVGSMFCHLDYCAGREQERVEKLFGVVKRIMEQRGPASVFGGHWPRQRVKPVFNDAACWEELRVMAGGVMSLMIFRCFLWSGIKSPASYSINDLWSNQN